MSDSKKTVRLPEVGEYVRMCGRLVQIEDVTPKEVVLDYIFETVSAKLDARINGHIVKEYGEFNEFYGEGTCVGNAVVEAQSHMQRLGESNLEFVVTKVTSYVRKRPNPNKRENFYDDQFRDMESLSHGCCWNVPPNKQEVVWSSKKPDVSQ